MRGIGKRFVYILRSDVDPNRHYVGVTSDVGNRLEWHNHGPCGHTTDYRPWRLVVALEFPTESQAVRFERYLKSGSGRAFATRHFGRGALVSMQESATRSGFRRTSSPAIQEEEAMVTITCSSKLHKAIGDGRVLESDAVRRPTVRLGHWAAVPAGEDLLVAIEERTCLTLVTRIRPVAGLRARLAEALRRSLINSGVSPEDIEPECRGIRQARIVRGRNPALVEALGFAQFEGQAHVEGGQDEASVQDMLNEYPYGECPASCPTEAVAMLFQPPVCAS